MSLSVLYLSFLIETLVVSKHTYSAQFRVGWFDASPDTQKRAILSVNNQFPPPTIIVQRGDVINITVINDSQEPTAIHWHGLLQRDTMDMDGVPGVTQCAIPPNQSYVYTFSTADQAGTYWYHSHFAMQYGDGLKGALIIQDPNDRWKKFYTDEDVLQLSDWYHTAVHVLLGPYIDPGTSDPVPDTGLINGIGQFNCTGENPCSYYQATLQSNTTKRFRIINTSVYAKITLTIDQHTMRVIEADGVTLDGTRYVRSLRLNPGQRYSVLVMAKSDPAVSYWIRATIHSFADYTGAYTSPSQPNASAVLQYLPSSKALVLPSMDTFNNDATIIEQSFTDGEIYGDEQGLVPINTTENQVPTGPASKTFIFNGQFQGGGNQSGFYFNNVTFVHPTNTTLLATVLDGNATELYASIDTHVESGDIVDVIMNNIDYASHPFHLHGHHAWLLASGKASDGYFNQSTQQNIVFNTVNPLYRDTYTVNPFSYLVFRFKADNPGLWMMHCHNDWHLQIGMAMVFVESPQIVQDSFSKKRSQMRSSATCQHNH